MNHSTPDIYDAPDVRDTLPDATALEHLAALCAQELAAAQTYQQALSVAGLSKHAGVLSRCYASHRNRAAALTELVAAFEGEVPKTPGVWSPLRPLLATPIVSVNDRFVIGLLEQAETDWTRSYRTEVPMLDAANREFVCNRILPAQEVTHAAIRDLRHLSY